MVYSIFVVHSNVDLLSIGRFAKITGLSLKALRLYAAIGLLSPAHTDPFNGYRYYDREQARPANLIRLMREMEMPLGEIRRILVADPIEAEGLIRAYESAFAERLAQVRDTGRSLKLIMRFQENAMSLKVETRDLKPQQIVSVEGHVLVDDLDAFIVHTLARLESFVVEQGGQVVGPPLGLYHGQINNEDDGPLEVCLLAEGGFRATDDIRIRELPGGRAAVVVAQGEHAAFPKILEAYDAGFDWVTRQGFQCIESPREVWLGSPQSAGPFEIVWRYE
jgi:DNA-binding transcriptional MerR regulator